MRKTIVPRLYSNPALGHRAKRNAAGQAGSRTSLSLSGCLRLAAISLFCGAVMLGCKRQDPVYDTDVDLGTEGQALLPNDLHHVYGDEEMRAGRVQDPDLSFLLPPEPEELDDEPEDLDEAGEIDPEIQALVQKHNQFLQAEDYEQAAALYKSEFRALAGLQFSLAGKLFEILDEIGADNPVTAMLKPMFEAASNMTLVSTTQDGAERILATMKPLAPGMPSTPWVFERIGDEWLIVGEEGTHEDIIEPLSDLFSKTNAQLDTILEGLSDDSLDPQAAAVQLQQALMSMGMQAQQLMQGDAEPDPSSPDESGHPEHPEESDPPAEDDSGQADPADDDGES